MLNSKQIKDQILAKADDDMDFRSRLVAEPRKAVAEVTSMELPSDLEIVVLEDTMSSVNLVLPTFQRLSSDDLEAVSGAVTMPTLSKQNW